MKKKNGKSMEEKMAQKLKNTLNFEEKIGGKK